MSQVWTRYFLIVLIASGIAGAANAASLVVTTTVDVVNGDTSSPDALINNPGLDGLSLREAILAVNAVSGPHTITFSTSLAGQTITLAEQLPFIRQDYVTLTGQTTSTGQPNITIDAERLTAARGTLVVVASHFTLTGLRLIGATDTIHYALSIAAGVLTSSAAAPQEISDIRIEGNAFSNQGIDKPGGCMQVFSDWIADAATIKRVTITGNTFIRCGGEDDGIKIQAGGSNVVIQDVVISNNRFSDSTYAIELTLNPGISSPGMNNQIRGTRILQNTILDSTQGISFYPVTTSGGLIDDTLIDGNIFMRNTGQAISLVGGDINATGNVVSNTRIINDLIVRSGQGGGIFIIDSMPDSTNNQVTGVSIVNNTIIHQGAGGSSGINVVTNQGLNNGITGMAVLNTILWGNSYTDLIGVPSSQVSFSIVAPSTPGFAGVNSNISADPKFVDPVNLDFHLLAGSPAIDAGTKAGAPSTDLDCRLRGATPDIGAFEYGGTSANCDPTTASITLLQGWNLVGNSVNSTLDVATTLADSTKVLTVWKWISNTGKWAFFTPSLVGQPLTDYANSRGYDVLTTANSGEGFWVNAKLGFPIQLPVGNAVTASSFLGMASGWNLISIGNTKTPSEFNIDMTASPPTTALVPLNITTLWAWDNSQGKWYFYAPSLEAQGGTTLSDYISSKGYLNFTTANKTLGAGVGFWVNKP